MPDGRLRFYGSSHERYGEAFYILLYLFLSRTYKNVDVVYIRHHTQAKEVDEQEFFYSQETGGTIVSSALKLMDEIVRERYNSAEWNVYAAQASDGDNWADDSPLCSELLAINCYRRCGITAISKSPAERTKRYGVNTKVSNNVLRTLRCSISENLTISTRYSENCFRLKSIRTESPNRQRSRSCRWRFSVLSPLTPSFTTEHL